MCFCTAVMELFLLSVHEQYNRGLRDRTSACQWYLNEHSGVQKVAKIFFYSGVLYAKTTDYEAHCSEDSALILIPQDFSMHLNFRRLLTACNRWRFGPQSAVHGLFMIMWQQEVSPPTSIFLHGSHILKKERNQKWKRSDICMKWTVFYDME